MLAQLVAQANQLGQIQPMAALQAFEQGHPLLQGSQAFRVALEGIPIAIQVAGQILQGHQAIAAGLPQGLQGGVQGFHLEQLLLTGRQVIQHRRRLVGSFQKAANQGGHPFLEAHPMGQAVFFGLESRPLLGILQLGRLQIGQHLLLL